MRSVPTTPDSARGMALISAMLIAALVASLAFALSARERLWLNQTANRQDLAAAQGAAFAAIDLARLTLRDDMRNNRVDHLLESWTVPIPPIAVEEGRVGGRLTELQGRFNLINLYSGGAVNDPALAALGRLLAGRSLPSAWAGRIAEALVKQVAPTSKGTSEPARVLPFANLSELAELAGIDAAQLAALETLVTILPESTPVNVNFAPPELLVAITPGLGLADAEQIVSRRAANHFKSVPDFLKALPEGARNTAVTAAYGVESQYFLSDIETAFGRAHLRWQALLHRQTGKMPELLWVRRL